MRPLALAVATVCFVAAFAYAVAGQGLPGTVGLIVFVLIGTTLVLEALGYRPEDLS